MILIMSSFYKDRKPEYHPLTHRAALTVHFSLEIPLLSESQMIQSPTGMHTLDRSRLQVSVDSLHQSDVTLSGPSCSAPSVPEPPSYPPVLSHTPDTKTLVLSASALRGGCGISQRTRWQSDQLFKLQISASGEKFDFFFSFFFCTFWPCIQSGW